MTIYAIMMRACGLSQSEAAGFHSVSIDTVKSWCAGRNRAPDGVLEELRELYEKIQNAADALIDIAEENSEAEIEIGFAADDHEAKALGWPCVGAQLASIAAAAMYIDQSIKLVPRRIDRRHSESRRRTPKMKGPARISAAGPG